MGTRMNERIKKLSEQAYDDIIERTGDIVVFQEDFQQRFAELIVRDCLNIAKNWDDQLVSANLVKESNAVGIVAYRIARQFGVEE
jgi:hypothetical protein